MANQQPPSDTRIMTSSTAKPPSVSSIEIGGSVIPMVSKRSCSTCRSPFRYDLEREVVLGVPAAEAVRRFPDSGVSARSLRDHVSQQHLDLRSEGVQKLREESANQQRQARLQLIGKLLYNHVDAESTKAKSSMAALLFELASIVNDGGFLLRGFEAAVKSHSPRASE